MIKIFAKNLVLINKFPRIILSTRLLNSGPHIKGFDILLTGMINFLNIKIAKYKPSTLFFEVCRKQNECGRYETPFRTLGAH